jgi:hypothetical protein
MTSRVRSQRVGKYVSVGNWIAGWLAVSLDAASLDCKALR